MENTPCGHDISLINHQIRKCGITQQAIASALGASQSQISRVLAGHSARRSKLLDKICIYVSSKTHGVSIESVRENNELMAALASVWDGTPDHAQALSAVIRSLAQLSLPRRDTFARASRTTPTSHTNRTGRGK